MLSKITSPVSRPARRFRAALPLCGGLLLGATTVSPLAASDLFQATATTFGTDQPLSATDSSNNLATLLKDIADTRSQFDRFDNTMFRGSIRYAGVDNAATFEISLVKQDANGNPLPRTAVFRFNDGRTASFQSASSSGLKDKIVDYFRQQGTAVTSDINSPLNTGDGNPTGVTAMASDATFNTFGTTAVNQASGTPQVDFSFLNPFNIDVSTFRAGDFDGLRLSVPLGLTYHIPRLFDDRVSLTLTGLFSYIKVNEAEIYQGGLFLGVPIQILKPQAWPTATAGKDGKGGGKAGPTLAPSLRDRLAWTVTPNGGAAVFGSVQLIQGGITYLGGMTSAFSVRLTERFTFTLGNAFNIARGGSLDVGKYHFDNTTDQVIFKNGINLSYRLTDRVSLESQGIATNFLNDAAIPAYGTFVLQTVFTQPLSSRSRTALVARLGFITDQAPDYHSYGGRFSLGLSF